MCPETCKGSGIHHFVSYCYCRYILVLYNRRRHDPEAIYHLEHYHDWSIGFNKGRPGIPYGQVISYKAPPELAKCAELWVKNQGMGLCFAHFVEKTLGNLI